MPRVLIADSFSPAAVDIFKQRGVDADIKTGLTKDELIKIIGDYDGLVVRSGHQGQQGRHRRRQRTSRSSAAPASASTTSTSPPPPPPGSW